MIGRNEPCPCGSGKKYKKCCLSKIESQYIKQVSGQKFEPEDGYAVPVSVSREDLEHRFLLENLKTRDQQEDLADDGDELELVVTEFLEKFDRLLDEMSAKPLLDLMGKAVAVDPDILSSFEPEEVDDLISFAYETNEQKQLLVLIDRILADGEPEAYDEYELPVVLVAEAFFSDQPTLLQRTVDHVILNWEKLPVTREALMEFFLVTAQETCINRLLDRWDCEDAEGAGKSPVLSMFSRLRALKPMLDGDCSVETLITENPSPVIAEMKSESLCQFKNLVDNSASLSDVLHPDHESWSIHECALPLAGLLRRRWGINWMTSFYLSRGVVIAIGAHLELKQKMPENIFLNVSMIWARLAQLNRFSVHEVSAVGYMRALNMLRQDILPLGLITEHDLDTFTGQAAAWLERFAESGEEGDIAYRLYRKGGFEPEGLVAK